LISLGQRCADIGVMVCRMHHSSKTVLIQNVFWNQDIQKELILKTSNTIKRIGKTFGYVIRGFGHWERCEEQSLVSIDIATSLRIIYHKAQPRCERCLCNCSSDRQP
jgi:hypothetical protein